MQSHTYSLALCLRHHSQSLWLLTHATSWAGEFGEQLLCIKGKQYDVSYDYDDDDDNDIKRRNSRILLSLTAAWSFFNMHAHVATAQCLSHMLHVSVTSLCKRRALLLILISYNHIYSLFIDFNYYLLKEGKKAVCKQWNRQKTLTF